MMTSLGVPVAEMHPHSMMLKLHHRDGISQIMSRAWCSSHIVLGVLPKQFNFVSPDNRVNNRMLPGSFKCCLANSGLFTAQVLLRWLSFQQFLPALQRTSEARGGFGFLVPSLAKALLVRLLRTANSTKSHVRSRLIPFHNYLGHCGNTQSFRNAFTPFSWSTIYLVTKCYSGVLWGIFGLHGMVFVLTCSVNPSILWISI